MFKKTLILKNLPKGLRGVFCLCLMLSCSELPRDKLDPKLDKNYKDYEKSLFGEDKIAQALAEDEDGEPPLPTISQIIESPKPPTVGEDKLVSISVTEDVPIRDVIMELSRISETDIELDPSITGGIILKVKNKPFSEVIERVCRLANLRYKVDNGVLRVEKDAPYMVTYNLDFLNIVRSSQSSSQVNTSVGSSNNSNSSSGNSSNNSSSGKGGSSSGNSGSTSSISSEYDGNLWKSVEDDINKIIGVKTANSEPGGGQSKNNNETYLSVNKQAGVLSVIANTRQQQQVKEYLNRVKSTVSSQVLIEAKVLEVTLNDEYRTGIDWTKVDRGFRNALGFAGTFSPEFTSSDQIAKFARYGKAGTPAAVSVNPNINEGNVNLETLVQLTEIFGTTKTLSSPRLHAMNNQQAVLSFVTNQVYFTLEITSTNSTSSNGTTTPGTTTVNSTLNTVPLGVILSLQPSINLETNEITMNIRPTISDQVGSVIDPAVQFAINSAKSNNIDVSGLQSSVPVVSVKELDSVMKIKSGQIMVIGGLMTQDDKNTDKGLPGVMKMPIVGNLFKSVDKTSQTIQTVIFIKATVVPTEGVVNSDKNFYNTFGRERDVNKFNLGDDI